MSENTDKMLDRLIDLTEAHAHNVLINLGEDLVPTWALFTEDMKLKLVPTPWADNNEKAFMLTAMRLYMRLNGVLVYSYVAEAWMARISEKEFTNPFGVVPPSERIDRQEVVVACAATADEVKWSRWDIERNDAGKVTALVNKLKMDGASLVESWMGGMLK